ncbi:hypothetical protein GCM10029976_009480 [Kribbella albertanoniae]|nr:hypothetical protein [Kribbella albertanoniae]
MDDSAVPVEHPEHQDPAPAGDDLIDELRDLLGRVPPQVIERADDARHPG